MTQPGARNPIGRKDSDRRSPFIGHEINLLLYNNHKESYKFNSRKNTSSSSPSSSIIIIIIIIIISIISMLHSISFTSAGVQTEAHQRRKAISNGTLKISPRHIRDSLPAIYLGHMTSSEQFRSSRPLPTHAGLNLSDIIWIHSQTPVGEVSSGAAFLECMGPVPRTRSRSSDFEFLKIGLESITSMEYLDTVVLAY